MCNGVKLEDIWEPDALHKLTEFYEKTSLRQMTNACKFSIEKAWKDDAELITGYHVKNAILEISCVNC